MAPNRFEIADAKNTLIEHFIEVSPVISYPEAQQLMQVIGRLAIQQYLLEKESGNEPIR